MEVRCISIRIPVHVLCAILGMLSAWLRMTYPEAVIGCVDSMSVICYTCLCLVLLRSYAASAPIWWFSNLTQCNV